jgi:hypothetical protein
LDVAVDDSTIEISTYGVKDAGITNAKARR